MTAEAPKVFPPAGSARFDHSMLYLLFFHQIFWAKMPGFAPWPARYCSKLEANDLRRRAVAKVGQVAAVFLERRMKRLVVFLQFNLWLKDH